MYGGLDWHFLSHSMANTPVCICCIPQRLQSTWLGVLARAASADESVDTLAQHRGGKAPKGTNSIYCFKECELTTAPPGTSLEFSVAWIPAIR